MVFGMPKEAIRRGAAGQVRALETLARRDRGIRRWLMSGPETRFPIPDCGVGASNGGAAGSGRAVQVEEGR